MSTRQHDPSAKSEVLALTCPASSRAAFRVFDLNWNHDEDNIWQPIVFAGPRCDESLDMRRLPVEAPDLF